MPEPWEVAYDIGGSHKAAQRKLLLYLEPHLKMAARHLEFEHPNARGVDEALDAFTEVLAWAKEDV
mgnify:CR=1 FL=1